MSTVFEREVIKRLEENTALTMGQYQDLSERLEKVAAQAKRSRLWSFITGLAMGIALMQYAVQ